MSVLISDSFKIRESTSDEWKDIQFSINSPGVPAGGQVEQFLIKNSNLDYDTKWATPNARHFFSLIWGLIYPVGSYYWSSESTSPEVLFGGTWEQVKDTFILAAGDNYDAGDNGGNIEHTHTTGDHTLTIEEIPSHIHNTYYSQFASGSAKWGIDPGTRGTSTDGSNVTQPTGGNQAHNHGNTSTESNMPPYIVAYCWHRIA